MGVWKGSLEVLLVVFAEGGRLLFGHDGELTGK